MNLNFKKMVRRSRKSRKCVGLTEKLQEVSFESVYLLGGNLYESYAAFRAA